MFHRLATELLYFSSSLLIYGLACSRPGTMVFHQRKSKAGLGAKSRMAITRLTKVIICHLAPTRLLNKSKTGLGADSD